VAGKVPDDLRRTAVRNLERAGVSRSAAMMMVGHRSESIYRVIAVTDELVLNESAAKLASFHQSEKTRKDLLFPQRDSDKTTRLNAEDNTR
jgi:hypothetical protein